MSDNAIPAIGGADSSGEPAPQLQVNIHSTVRVVLEVPVGVDVVASIRIDLKDRKGITSGEEATGFIKFGVKNPDQPPPPIS